MIFQGQEFLEDRWFEDTRPLNWDKVRLHQGIWQIYRDLIALRRNLTGTTAGLTGPHINLYHLNNQNKSASLPSLAQRCPATMW